VTQIPTTASLVYSYISYSPAFQQVNVSPPNFAVYEAEGDHESSPIYSNAFFSQSSRSCSVVSLVVPHTCHGPDFQASYFFCRTMYSITSFSLPEPGTICSSAPLTLVHLVSFCLEHIRTTACLIAPPSIGNLAPRFDTIFALLLYFTSSHCTISPRGRLLIRARKLSYIPSVHILRRDVMSPSAKEEYICRCSATAVGAIVDRESFRFRLIMPFSLGEENLRTRREN